MFPSLPLFFSHSLVKEENFHVDLENVDTSMKVRGQKGMDGKERSRI